MKPRQFPCVIFLALASSLGTAQAQVRWRDMPLEDRQQLRQQMREHWQQESNYRQEGDGSRWRDMPQEDRRRMREEMRDQGAWGDGRSERGGPSGGFGPAGGVPGMGHGFPGGGPGGHGRR